MAPERKNKPKIARHFLIGMQLVLTPRATSSAQDQAEANIYRPCAYIILTLGMEQGGVIGRRLMYINRARRLGVGGVHYLFGTRAHHLSFH